MTAHTPAPALRLIDRPYLLLIFATAQWGANTLFGRLAVGEISPMQLGTLRWLFVAVVLGWFTRRELAADWASLMTRPWLVIMLGATGFTGFTAFLYLAAHHTTAANMSIIQGSMPLFVFSFAWAIHGRPIGRAQAAGMVLALLGVALVASRGDLAVLTGLAFNIGDLYMIGATICYAIYTVGLESRPKASAISFFMVAVVAAFLTSLPLLAIEAMTAPVHWPTPTGWLLTLVVAIFPSCLAQLSFIRGVQLIGPGRAGMFVNLIPVFGASMAVVFLGEPFGWHQGAGLALVMAGIVLAQRR